MATMARYMAQNKCCIIIIIKCKTEMEVSHKTHRPHVKVGKDAEEGKNWGIVIPSRTKRPSTNLYNSEFDLLALLNVAFRLHHLTEVEEHARVLVGASDEAERVLHRRNDTLQHTALHVERNKHR